ALPLLAEPCDSGLTLAHLYLAHLLLTLAVRAEGGFMKRLLTLSLGVVCLALGIVACEKSPKAAESKMTDADLERAITASINTDATLTAYRIGVSGDAEKNTATLTGTVPTEAARTRIVELAKAGRPNLVVTDKIDVKPPELERKDYTTEMAREAREKAKGSGETIGENI